MCDLATWKSWNNTTQDTGEMLREVSLPTYNILPYFSMSRAIVSCSFIVFDLTNTLMEPICLPWKGNCSPGGRRSRTMWWRDDLLPDGRRYDRPHPRRLTGTSNRDRIRIPAIIHLSLTMPNFIINVILHQGCRRSVNPCLV